MKPLISDEEVEGEWATTIDGHEASLARQKSLAGEWCPHVSRFARRIESLVRKRLAEKLRNFMLDQGANSCCMLADEAAGIVESDE